MIPKAETSSQRVLRQAADVRDCLHGARQRVDEVWCFLEDACEPEGQRTFTHEGARDAGRDAVFFLLQAIREAERAMDEIEEAAGTLDAPT